MDKQQSADSTALSAAPSTSDFSSAMASAETTEVQTETLNKGEQRKRMFSDMSDKSESTGVSPEVKRQTFNIKRLTMPSDDATVLEWHKTIFLKIDEVFDSYEFMRRDFDELRNSLNFSQEKVTECENKIEGMQGRINNLEQQITTLEREKTELKSQFTNLAEGLLKSEIKLREQNLVFEGIAETYGEDASLLHRKITGVLNNMMVFNGQAPKIPLRKIERSGAYVKGQTRPIVCCFARYNDVQTVLKNRTQLPNNVFVHEDYPTQIEDRRRLLRPILNKAKKMTEYAGKCRLIEDKLMINGKVYTAGPTNNLHTLPKVLHPRNAAEKSNDDVHVFFTQGSPLSNFHPATFMKDNVKFVSNEQYIQAKKAETFNDDHSHAKIMEATNPYEIKKLGSRIKDFVKPKWEQVAKQIVMEGCLAKFSQNSHLLEILLETGQKEIGEASKDPFWGIGRSLNDPSVLDKNSWTGENLLGNTLMYIREQLS